VKRCARNLAEPGWQPGKRLARTRGEVPGFCSIRDNRKETGSGMKDRKKDRCG